MNTKYQIHYHWIKNTKYIISKYKILSVSLSLTKPVRGNKYKFWFVKKYLDFQKKILNLWVEINKYFYILTKIYVKPVSGKPGEGTVAMTVVRLCPFLIFIF